MPYKCVILAVDPLPGFCISVNGVYSQSGVAKTSGLRDDAVKLAVSFASVKELPLVVVIEKPSNRYLPRKVKNKKTGKWEQGVMGMEQILGMGENRGRWRESIERFSKVPKKRVILVDEKTWSKPIGVNAKGTENRKRQCCQIVSAWSGKEIRDWDEGDAGGICFFATHWPVVGELIGAKL